MTDTHRSFRPRGRIAARLVAATAGAAFLAPPTAGLAQSTVPTATATYEVFATPLGSTRLCPGESVDFLVSINRVSQRGSTNSVPYAVVIGTVITGSIGTLSPVLISPGGASSGGYFKKATFTANAIGQTRIDFTGNFFPNINAPVSSPQGAPVPAVPTSVTVNVECKFDLSLYGVWQLPGERLLDVMGAVSRARITPDAQGNFSTTATMSSTGVWIGGCTGTSKIKRSRVNISGRVGFGSKVDVNLAFDPASSVTTEGCHGKSRADRGQLEPLTISLDRQGETRDYPHVLGTYVNAAGNTTVVLRRLP